MAIFLGMILGCLLGAVLANMSLGFPLGIAAAVVSHGSCRIGDTSDMRRIDAYALQVAGTQPAGGSISRLRSENPKINGLEVLLKAGQSGSDDVLLRALSGEGWI